MGKLKIVLSSIFLLLFLKSSYSQDWANLKRFQKDNTALMNSNSKGPRIVLMGNSITEGWLNFQPEFFEDKNYINRGIGGQTTPQMLLRFRQDVVDLKPAVVVILAGINDIAENTGPSTIEMIEDNIISMAEIAKANHIKVVLSSVLPAYDFPWRQGLEPAEKVVRLNKLLKSYAEKHNLVYLDYFSSMANKKNALIEELGYDGVHPNAAGYKVMEPLFEKAVKKALIKN